MAAPPIDYQKLAESQAFAPLHGLNEREEVLANTRVFQGDGTHYLKVPGLLELTGVKLANQVFPTEIEIEYPTDRTMRRLATVTLPMFSLERMQDGTPVLRRNMGSNDGVFQSEADFYVFGLWDETVPPPDPPEPKRPRKGR